MKEKFLLLLLLFVGLVYAQEPALKIPLVINDGVNEGTLFFGIDSNATNQIDAQLGEIEQPPQPPTGVFDLRFVNVGETNIGEGVLEDYRFGEETGTITHTHKISIRHGEGGPNWTINYDLTEGVSITFKDPFGGTIINQKVSGSGSLVIGNNIKDLLMIVVYNFFIPPYNLQIDESTPGQLGLSWSDENDNEDGFIIERADDQTRSYSEVGRTSTDIISFTDLSVEQTSTYSYRVKAYNQFGESEYSNTANGTVGIIPINAPTQLIASAVEFGRIDLSWRDNSNHESGFYVERSLESVRDFIVIATLGRNKTNYEDTNVEENTTYVYRVKAFSPYYESGYSNEAQVTSLLGTINPPSNLTVDSTVAGELRLQWEDNSDNEDGFVIERNNNPEVREFEEIYRTEKNITNYSDENVIQNENYTYRIKAFNAFKESEFSNEANGTVIPIPIEKVTNLTASANTYDQIDLGWTDNSQNENGFYLFRRESSEEEFISYDTLGENTTEYSDLNVEQGKTYYYFIQAFNQFTTSDSSEIASTTALIKPINAPTNLDATPNENGDINLSWEDNSDNENGFYIEREELNTREYVRIDSVQENVVNYIDSIVEVGISYKYRLQAFNNYTVSEYSNETSISLGLNAPSELTAISEHEETIKLTWKDNSSFEEGFVIERRQPVQREFEEIATVDPNVVEYEDNPLEENFYYEYRVKAFDQFAESDYSEIIGTTTLINAPTNLTSQIISPTEIKLEWEDNSKVETNYSIVRAENDSVNFVEIDQVDLNITEYIDNNIIESVKYYYKVKATAGDNFSNYSNTANIISQIENVTNLVGIADVFGNVELTWQDNSEVEDGFRIYREDPTLRMFEALDVVPANVTEYFDHTTEEASTYRYMVIAFTDLVNSEGSNIAEVTTAVIASPDSISATPSDTGSVIINWVDSSSREEGFSINRSSDNETREDIFVEIGRVPANTTIFVDTSVEENTNYKYRIYAYNETEESSSSETETETIRTVAIAAPTNLKPIVNLNFESPLSWNILLTWRDNSNIETGFIIDKEIHSGTKREFGDRIEIPANSTSFIDSALVSKQTIVYRIAAINTDTASAFNYSDTLKLNFVPEFVNLPDVVFDEDESANLILPHFVKDLDDEPSQLAFTATVVTDQNDKHNNKIEEENDNLETNSDLTVLIDENNNAIFWGAQDAFGDFKVEFTVTDSDGASAVDTIVVTITPVNDAPIVLSIPEINLDEDSSVSLELNDYVTDVDNDAEEMIWTAELITESLFAQNKEQDSVLIFDPSKYSIKNNSNCLSIFIIGNINDSLTVSIDQTTNIATIEATNNFFGVVPVRFTATDPGGLSDSDETIINVNPVNDPPVLSFPSVLTLYNNSDTTFAIDDYVSDDETLFENLVFEFSSSNDSLLLSLNNNLLTITVLPGIVGNAEIRIRVIDEGQLFAETTISVDIEPTSVNYLDEIPTIYSLENNYPNPFNPSTVIRFGIPFRSNVTLEIFNILGERIQMLINKEFDAGYHEYNFNASGLASGIYLYSINAESQLNKQNFRSIKKMMLVK